MRHINPTTGDFYVRIAAKDGRSEDAERLLEIYAPYVEKTTITFEDVVPAVSEFEARIARTLKQYPYLVVLKVGQIVGYAHASPFKEPGSLCPQRGIVYLC